MWKAKFGKEPFDLRLTLLRMWKKLPMLTALVVLLTVLLGGGYYVKNVVFCPAKTYEAASVYKIEFANENWAQYGTYINETSWNTWVHTKEFLDYVQKHLTEEETQYEITEQELDSALSAKLLSDLRMPSTYVVTDDPGKSEAIARAVEKTMTGEFVAGVSADIASIRVVDPGKATEVYPDVRPKRAFILAAIVSVLFVFGIYLLLEIGDDSIWLPATLRTRYGLVPLGTIGDKYCKENLAYVFKDYEQVMIVPVQQEIDPVKVAERLSSMTDKPMQFIPVPSPSLEPAETESLRKAGGCLLAVKAGDRVGKPLEEVLHFLHTQDVKVTAVLLWEADEKLIRRYYRLNLKEKA